MMVLVAEHRRRLLERLSGVVVELGASDGANFAQNPDAVTEVIAIEPEPALSRSAVPRTAACSLPAPG
jgi:hypothetical protein